MKKVIAVSVMLSASMLSGCMTEATMKQMSADCAKVGGAMETGWGVFGPSAECHLPKQQK